MSDTIPMVRWSIARPCEFRQGPEWYKWLPSWQQLQDLHTIDNCERNGRLFDGICVTGFARGRDLSRRHYGENRIKYEIPLEGFRVADRLGPHRRWPKVLATCSGCEANVCGYYGKRVCGCFNTIYMEHYSRTLDDKLREIVRARGCEQRLRELFVPTSLLWFSFWIESPLRPQQLVLLHEVLSALSDATAHYEARLASILKALLAAMRYELPLHVSLDAPGHSDCGRSTTFAHCPRCKCEYPTTDPCSGIPPGTSHNCAVCGLLYYPAHSYQDEEYLREKAEIRERGTLQMLLQHEYLTFVKNYNIHRGVPPDKAEELLVDVQSDRQHRVVFRG